MIKIPLTKLVTAEVPNGEMHIKKVDGAYQLEYHNDNFVESPFKMPTQFNVASFTVEELMKSYEVQTFLMRFR